MWRVSAPRHESAALFHLLDDGDGKAHCSFVLFPRPLPSTWQRHLTFRELIAWLGDVRGIAWAFPELCEESTRAPDERIHAKQRCRLIDGLGMPICPAKAALANVFFVFCLVLQRQ